ncbi:phosphoribosyl transferase [Candidatus Peregrinibacteria bacterium CG10_big_fil_rev_8_21_14_0_10_49_16]|nr:MAG: phosphoribosyl transferase [Candidatus Peregrinibacteria bacterium CG22_combo_CG10-13_8_21_14_all_49_11]PIR52228.1 MAG: phosphoribosyl transferase [Candidatus Peregrinibacteria bacterium CG10_big_fil_rev_8_21_14_0_10_49_16]
MPFIDRRDAAAKLAARLEKYRAVHPLILAIPRGAVPMGKVIAEELNGELDVVLVRKLGAPGQEEYAIGAVDETGNVYLNPETRYTVEDPYVQQETERQLALIRKRRKAYTPLRDPIDPKDRTVIVVDDGSATGSTMLAALHAVRAQRPKTLIAALGVAPPDTVKKLEEVADDVVCLETHHLFFAVGQFFQNFEQVSDTEVEECLR